MHVPWKPTPYLGLLVATVSIASAACVTVAAPIFDISDFGAASGVVLAGNASIVGPKIRLTDSHFNRRSAAWLATPQDITQSFTARLSFTISNPDTFRANAPNGADGLTLVLQNDPRAPLDAVLGGDGNQLGYGMQPGFSAIQHSLAVTFRTFVYQQVQVYANDNNPDYLLLYFEPGGGATPLARQQGNLGNVVNIPQILSLTYDAPAQVITVRLNDQSIGIESVPLGRSLESIVGNNTATFGFTASTGGGGWSTIDVTRFSATPVPEPTTITLAGFVLVSGRRRRRWSE